MNKKIAIKLMTGSILALALAACGQNFESSEKTPHQIGVFSSGYMYSKKPEAGVLAFGPYIKLNPGKYTAVFEVQSLGDDLNFIEAGYVDVVRNNGQDQLIKGVIPSDPKNEKISLNFTVEKNDDQLYEFRVFANGSNSIKFKSVKLKN